jgi:predicted AlkP superfamily pyrophosphatase or phosphodiesterase
MSDARSRRSSAPLAAGLVSILAATLLAGPPVRQGEPRPPAGPRLVVLVVVDQFRSDYAEWYGAQWTKGLRRLFDTGAVMTNAAYPYAATLTCAGHATIGTGTFPAAHGMSGNDFYDRALRRTVPCAFDADALSVPFGGEAGSEHHSPRSLLRPTFAEELRRQARVPPRVVVLGQKPRTAITLAGKSGPDTVVLWEEDDGTWASSSAYTKAPWPDVDAFVAAHPLKADYGKVWTRVLPVDAYRHADDGPGEGTPAPWGRTFPHPLVSRSGQPDNEFVSAWERSPWNDAFLTDLAIHLIGTRRLGAGPGTDYLAVSFPSTDHAGHEFGPHSHEVQDTLVRVDANLGRLIDAIEARVGRDYVIGLSSDHGVAVIPERTVADGAEGGRISTTALRTAVNAAVEKALGAPGPHVASIYEEQIALVPGVYDRLRSKAGAFEAIIAAIRSVKGVAEAYAADDLMDGAPTDDPGLRAWRLSYVPGRSGDFALTPRPNWIVRSSSGTTHGTPHAYDQRVPVILAGAGIRPGRYPGTSSPADLVTTLAAIVGIEMPRAQGRVLTEVIAR